jgi:hypothetical protein
MGHFETVRQQGRAMTILSFWKYVIFGMPVLAVVGIATALLGSVQIGTGLFLCGVAAFFLGMGGLNLSLMVLTAKICGVHVIRERPLYSTFGGVLSALFFYQGSACSAELYGNIF